MRPVAPPRGTGSRRSPPRLSSRLSTAARDVADLSVFARAGRTLLSGLSSPSARLLAGRPERRAAQLAVGLAAVALGATSSALLYGHPADAAVPLLWVLAGVEARRDRRLRAGALVGLGAGLGSGACSASPSSHSRPGSGRRRRAGSRPARRP